MSNNKLFVNFDIKESKASNNNVEVSTQPLGTKIDNRKDITLSYYGTAYYLQSMIDDDLSFKEGAYLYFTFPKVRNIKTIIIKTREGNEMKALSLYAGFSQGHEQI